MDRILWFKDTAITDIPKVGGKNASLGEMYNTLTPKGVNVPNGFSITAKAYQEFLETNKLHNKIKEVLKGLNTRNIKNLQNKGRSIRQLILSANLPHELEEEVVAAYQTLSKQYHKELADVAIRSSATAEDLPGASFAGQQVTYLDVVGKKQLLKAVKGCFSSLFTDRAISYRVDKGFDHLKTYLSIGIQKMVRSDKASSGVIFTLDPDTGFPGVVVVTGSWGLGEMVVQGEVIPDEFQVFKGTLKEGFPAIISKELGSKERLMVYDNVKGGTRIIPASPEKMSRFILTDPEVLQLARWSVLIEEHYQKFMDIEWAKDGTTGDLYIVQARPETIHAGKKSNQITNYVMKKPTILVAKGAAVGTKIGEGKVNIIISASKINKFQKGEVLVTKMTDPDWEPIMKIASAIVTDEGGRTSHAAIVSRELGIPCVVGAQNATAKLKAGELVTVDCSNGSDGFIWKGKCEWKTQSYSLDNLKTPRTKIMVNIGSPTEAYAASFLPNEGVGLAREEFIIASQIKAHPNALINFREIKDLELRHKIEKLTIGYNDCEDFYVQRLAQGIGQIAAAFYPKKVIVRFSDFKTNEYATLLGGEYFEPKEENPMIGWRGASRYYDPRFKEAFGLECKAVKIVRNKWGLTNLAVMIPFCRTPEEGQQVLDTMNKFGLKKGDNGLLVYMMAEIPSNILLAEEFAKIFDGFSIGSNDLTQLTLGIDRDNAHLGKIANENNPAVKKLIMHVIKVAKKQYKYIGICGQAPSDYPDFAKFLVENGIESISLNPDSILKTTLAILEEEERLRQGIKRWLS